MCIIICDYKKISFTQIMVEWFKACSLNMEVKGSEGFKLSHLHLKIGGLSF